LRIERQPSRLKGTAKRWRARSFAIALLVLLAACGGESGDTPGRGAGQVNFYNWSNYIHPDTLPAFTAQTGVRVVYDVYDSNDVLEGKLLAGNTGYDLVVPTGNFFRNQRNAGLFQPIDRSRLNNYEHLDPGILARLAEIDPDNAYAIPYAWGTTGLGVNLARIRERLPDAPLDSWALLFDPEIVRHLQDCGVTLVDASDELAEIGLNYLGFSPHSTDLDELRAAMELVQAIRPYVRYFHSSQYIDDFANGEACLVLGWSGDIFQAIDNAREGLELDYVIPREGTVLWFDLLAIPADAPNADNAHLLLDHLLDPGIAAGLTNETFFPSGNLGAREWIEPEIRDDPSIFPPPDVMARLFVHPVHSPDYVRQRNRLWTTVKTGR